MIQATHANYGGLKRDASKRTRISPIKSNRTIFIYLLLPFNKLEGSLNKYDKEIIFMDFMQIVYFVLFESVFVCMNIP